MATTTFSAFVNWPSAPLTQRLVTEALQGLPHPPPDIASDFGALKNVNRCLQWCTYDAIDHDKTLANPTSVLASSYTIRKALIRKHFLHRCIHAYTVKNATSILSRAVPKTWDIDISYADELDELWSDDLWDLGREIDAQCDSDADMKKWWILKPSMADRGMGIRLFDSKEALRQIFEEFDEDSGSEHSDEEAGQLGDTGVIASQLRHFVIQEYLSNPVLIDPDEASKSSVESKETESSSQKRKFHLRAYCVASGSLTVYLYTRILALFSAVPYTPPGTASNLDLRPHLTNTCLQENHDERNVRLLDELVGCRFATSSGEFIFSESNKNTVINQMAGVLANTFEAATQVPIHFQALPNAFELYGVDFLVTHDGTSDALQVMLLEVNAEPAIEMTGARLTWVLEDLFKAIADTCVGPFFRGNDSSTIGQGGTTTTQDATEGDKENGTRPGLLRECYRRQRWA